MDPPPSVTYVRGSDIFEDGGNMGDPVCWLDQVCDTCGLLDEPVEGRCRRCGGVLAPDGPKGGTAERDEQDPTGPRREG